MRKDDIVEDITDQVDKLIRRRIVDEAYVILTVEEAKFLLTLLNAPYVEKIKRKETGEAGAETA